MRKKILDNKKTILLFVIISIFIFIQIWTFALRDINSLWNYNFARKISQGYVPYRDFNMLQTPFYFYVMSLFLKIFGNQMLIYVIGETLISVSIIIVLYKVFLNIHKNKDEALSYLGIGSIFYMSFLLFVSYNDLCSLLVLLALYLELKNRKKQVKHFDYFIGILMTVCLFTKQSTGLVFFIINIGLLFIEKREVKLKIKSFVKRNSIFLVLSLAYLFYLHCNNAMYNFYDYTILGIREFKDNNLKITSLTIIVFLLALFPIVKSIIVYFKTKDNQILILLSYLAVILSSSYPIFDINHTYVFVFFVILLFPYAFKRKYIVNIFVIIFSIIIYIIVLNNLRTSSNFVFYNDSKYYKLVPINPSLKESIIDITAYIQKEEKTGTKVIMVDNFSAYFTIELSQNNNYFDLPLQGNLGFNGEQKVIKEIKSMKKGTKFLISNANDYQELSNTKNYIRHNYKEIGTIGRYYIYEK